MKHKSMFDKRILNGVIKKFFIWHFKIFTVIYIVHFQQKKSGATSWSVPGHIISMMFQTTRVATYSDQTIQNIHCKPFVDLFRTPRNQESYHKIHLYIKYQCKYVQLLNIKGCVKRKPFCSRVRTIVYLCFFLFDQCTKCQKTI